MPDGRTLRRFVVYAGVGAIGTAAQYAVLITLVTAGLANPVTGSMTGAGVGAVVNYWLNRRVTFRHGSSHLKAVPRFAAIALLGVAVNGLLMNLLTRHLDANYLIAQVAATGVVLGITYILNSVWTFKGHGAEAV
ncbi:GtrA family protein [Paraburkholderia sp. GAS42]|jgi:putative flippase GtrA|uniref:GtrA family protein n=1 Tax=Paraburkholderia sp. GAS42 TaxID=3035135 RepID=UPI003D2288C2